MKRRGFLGALLASPVAAKAAADAGISEAGSPLAYGPSAVPVYGASVAGPNASIGGWSPLLEAKERIAKLAITEATIRREARRGVHRLDVDLASNRSMSLAAKMHIQAGRDADIRIGQERTWADEGLERAKRIMGLA